MRSGRLRIVMTGEKQWGEALTWCMREEERKGEERRGEERRGEGSDWALWFWGK